MAKSKANKRKSVVATNGSPVKPMMSPPQAPPATMSSNAVPSNAVAAPSSNTLVPKHATAMDHPRQPPLQWTFLDEYIKTAAYIPSCIGDSKELVYLTQRDIALAKLDILGKHIVEKMPDFEESRKKGQLQEDQYQKFKEMEKAYRAKMQATDAAIAAAPGAMRGDSKGKGKSAALALPFPPYGHPQPYWSPTPEQLASPSLSRYTPHEVEDLSDLIQYAIRPPPGWKDREEAHVESNHYRPYAYTSDYVALRMIRKMPIYVSMMRSGELTEKQLAQAKAVAREHALKVLARHARTQAIGVDEATQQLANMALVPSPTSGGEVATVNGDGTGGGKGKRKGGK
ncbi:hypothetical protein DACRYDRAFT_119528 [Dacryopinax primogenitus]|uniref:Uncharacterized protein n=1 Tax=Dacryopinax primogenitus (strain DJM 731) TaxID=1858805 RepID=M5G0Y0_DACPD|nr:uncharacterized protein DACRYDRAFT_119528 [Dacryopinax primogenitus]EJT97442.1 hypothetical protein DACRYDRAFT_119528 [Dacryopinax primogenitus]